MSIQRLHGRSTERNSVARSTLESITREVEAEYDSLYRSKENVPELKKLEGSRHIQDHMDHLADTVKLSKNEYNEIFR